MSSARPPGRAGVRFRFDTRLDPRQAAFAFGAFAHAFELDSLRKRAPARIPARPWRCRPSPWRKRAGAAGAT
jgi:hypothetical protein